MADRGDLCTPFKDSVMPTQNPKDNFGGTFNSPMNSSGMPSPTPSTDIREVQFIDIPGAPVGGPGE